MIKENSISSGINSEKELSPPTADYNQVDVAAQLAAGGYGESISEADALRVRHAFTYNNARDRTH